MRQRAKLGVKFSADISALNGLHEGAKVRGAWRWECRDKDGNLKWVEEYENLVTNVGLDHVLSAVIAAGTQITSWFVGLIATSPSIVAADTMSSHGGWTEVHTQYSQATRPAFTPGAVSGQAVSNSASKAVFTITNDVTVGGAFLVSNSVKNGSTGTLFSAGAFVSGNRALLTGDTLNVQCTYTAADDGV